MTIDQLEAWFLDDESPTFEMIVESDTYEQAYAIAYHRLYQCGVPVEDQLLMDMIRSIRCRI